MVFEKYYTQLARKSVRTAPRADEAKRDYLDALNRTIDGYLAGR